MVASRVTFICKGHFGISSGARVYTAHSVSAKYPEGIIDDRSDNEPH